MHRLTPRQAAGAASLDATIAALQASVADNRKEMRRLERIAIRDGARMNEMEFQTGDFMRLERLIPIYPGDDFETMLGRVLPLWQGHRSVGKLGHYSYDRNTRAGLFQAVVALRCLVRRDRAAKVEQFRPRVSVTVSGGEAA